MQRSAVGMAGLEAVPSAHMREAPSIRWGVLSCAAVLRGPTHGCDGHLGAGPRWFRPTELFTAYSD